MKRFKGTILAACLGAAALAVCQTASAIPITGDPAADGWASFGNSLSKSVYVKGDANYSYDTYAAGFTVQSASKFDTGGSNFEWLTGDKVLGIGGVFQSNPTNLGWSVSGDAINSALRADTQGPKLQVKFGTANATWKTSTSAPSNGIGVSSSDSGGGRIQIRTSAWNKTTAWENGAGQLLVPSNSHVAWDNPLGNNPPNDDVAAQSARIIWNFDDTANLVESWEIMLNVSLLDRIKPNYTGLFPSFGDMAVLTVQDRAGDYTDSLVRISRVQPNAVPAPGSLFLFAAGLIGLAVVVLRRGRA